VHHDNRWKSVCSREMNQDIARSMCSQLGKTGGKVLPGTEKQGEQSWVKLIQCPEGASRISDCIVQELDVNEMAGCKEVNIECDNEAGGDLFHGIRILMSNSRKVQPAIKGRLEVLYKDQWGTVCSDHFDSRDAQVACRNLGLTGGHTLGNWEEPGEGRIWLDDLFCKGTEKKLEQCSRS